MDLPSLPDGAPSFVDLGFARVDTDRRRRCGFPEVIFCQGKTPDEVAAIAQTVLAHDPVVLGTRATPEHFAAVAQVLPAAVYHARGRCNRIYGCDDCQLVCPWNRFAERSPLPDFDARSIAHATLLEVFAWDDEEFLRRAEGSAIRRIGHERWQRNVAVALGNALAADLAAEDRVAIHAALDAKRDAASPLVREHIDWARTQDRATAPVSAANDPPG